MTRKEVYFSVDIESDGPIPGENSMLSIGAVACAENGQILSTFYVNLDELPGAKQDPKTMEFWKENPEAWKAARESPQDPEFVMDKMRIWIGDICKKHNARPVFIGYPATFDFMFLHWYMIKFTGGDPFSFHGLDIKSYAMAVLGCRFKASKKSNYPKWAQEGITSEGKHIAIEDAFNQAEIFFNFKKHVDQQQKVRKLHGLLTQVGF